MLLPKLMLRTMTQVRGLQDIDARVGRDYALKSQLLRDLEASKCELQQLLQLTSSIVSQRALLAEEETCSSQVRSSPGSPTSDDVLRAVHEWAIALNCWSRHLDYR